jgi:uncharacterized protein (TIGR02284 family)
MPDDPLDQLTRLVYVNRDAEAAFRNAAANIRNTELETQFNGYAEQHATFSAELQGEIAHHGGRVPEGGTAGGAIHRGWMDVKSAITGHSAAAILASCETGEQSVEVAYLDFTDAVPSGKLHTLTAKQLEQVKAIRTRLARLVSETKERVDFQKNE